MSHSSQAIGEASQLNEDSTWGGVGCVRAVQMAPSRGRDAETGSAKSHKLAGLPHSTGRGYCTAPCGVAEPTAVLGNQDSFANSFCGAWV